MNFKDKLKQLEEKAREKDKRKIKVIIRNSEKEPAIEPNEEVIFIGKKKNN